ncbi:MAG: hypothetical protein WAN86_21560 [Hyphomicrobiaceae bacterium]
MTAPVERILYGGTRPDGRTPYWRMPTIWAAAAGKPQTTVALDDRRILDILDAVVWFGGPKNVEPTVRRIAEHARDIVAADMSQPIIITAAGEVLDGAHRIAKAHLEGTHSIAAVIIDDWPPPDGFVEAPPAPM